MVYLTLGTSFLPRMCVALVVRDRVDETALDQCDAHGLPQDAPGAGNKAGAITELQQKYEYHPSINLLIKRLLLNKINFEKSRLIFIKYS